MLSDKGGGNNSGLGSSVVSVSSGGTLQLRGGVSVSNALTLAGAGFSSSGALRSVSGSNSWTGGITVSSASTRINSDAGRVDAWGFFFDQQ